MFDIIKQRLSLLERIEKDLDVNFRQMGDKNWVIDGGKDTEACPFCSHHDCFRVHFEEGNNSSSFYKCFSCGEYGDIITWVSKRTNQDVVKAARQLAQENDIKLPNDYSPIQQIFNLAADYYHNCLIETCNRPYPVLNGLTPLRYQTEIRRRKPESITKYKIGYSDGGLVDYLDSLGIDKELIEKSGLMAKTGGKDFLPSHCFIYPHFVRGRVSHFTFKDPLKRVQYQLPKKFSLNGYLFYGQDTAAESQSIALVEGENDWLSVQEAGGVATLAIIGQISGEQLEWLREHCAKKRIVTIFDPDEAGDKYREKVEGLRKHFSGLVHIKPPEDKDIDDHLSNGASFKDIIQNNRVEVSVKAPPTRVAPVMPWDEVLGPTTPPSKSLTRPVETVSEAGSTEVASGEEKPASGAVELSPGMTLVGPTTAATEYTPPVMATQFGTELDTGGDGEIIELEDSSVIQMKNCYYKVAYKEGEAKYTRISDFTVELKNIYLDDDAGKMDRKREIVIRKQDGYRSDVIEVDSETKVSYQRFKVLVAKAADAEWMGKDADLEGMWRLVYSQFPEATIRIVRQVGRVEKHRFWIFKNLLITDNGVEITPDDNGIFWISGKTSGVKLKGISDSEEADGIPSIRTSLTREESTHLLGEVVRGLAKNFKSLGPALMSLGWIKANIYSNYIYKQDGGMGMMMLWGVGGKGKSTISKWLQSFFGFNDKMASTSVQQLKSTAGFMRKGAFYASLPLFLDELRADDLSNQYLGMIRSWYDRESRTLADKDSNTVRTLPIRSTLLVAGEDLPADPATRERFIMIRVPPNNLEDISLQLNYEMMRDNSENFSNITYYWIRDFCNQDLKLTLAGIRDLDKELVKAGCSNRISKVWASAAYFARQMAQEYCPEYDFMSYLIETCKLEQKQQKSENTLNKFFENMSAIHARENSRITNQHICREGDRVHIWFAAAYKEVADDARHSEKWSKHAILRSIKEEPYYISDDKKVCMGLSGVRRVVLTLDLTKCPESIRTMVEYEISESTTTQGVEVK